MLRICFYGGPGVGKSTLAARVYAELNRTGARTTELVREFVKSWAYEGRRLDGWDQVYIFGSQLWAEHRLAKAGVQVIVTDSPILLQCIYTSLVDAPISLDLVNLALRYERVHSVLNFLVERRVEYDPTGRFQTRDQLAAVDAQIKDYLDHLKVPYLLVTPADWETIIQTVKEAAYSVP